MKELTPILREVVTHVHDQAVRQTAAHAAGRYGPYDEVYLRFTELARTEADRAALAELMFTCVSRAVHAAMWFVDERNTTGHIEVTVSDGSKPYTLRGTDMVIHWFQAILEEHSTESPQTLLAEIDRLAAGGEIRPLPAYTEFPPLRPAE